MTTRVLVVDDDPAVRSAIARALRVDYDVDEAGDGTEALA
jgi:CheY-like chemotaxis protein